MPAPPASPPGSASTSARTPAAAADSDEALARDMHVSVKALLDAVPMSRRVLQGLAAVEHALAIDGLEGIDWLPQAVLEKACVQLKSLPLPADNKALPQLLALIDLVVATRIARHAPGPQHTNEFLSSFLNEEKLVVSEASHTDFVRLSLHVDPPKDP